MRLISVLAAASVLACAAWPRVEAHQSPSATSLLRAAGQYLARSDSESSGIVADEDYVQRAGSDTRHLRSEFVVTDDPAAGVVEFRDVIEVDGKPVSDRRDRLASLLTARGSDPLKEAQRLTDESARFNLNAPNAPAIDRTLNLPRIALEFLRTVSQPRSQFTLAGVESAGDASAAVLSFEERARPRLIQSPTNAAARGRFWIDRADGRIVRSELRIDTAISATSHVVVAATVRVSYAVDARLHVSLPVGMDEHYDISASARTVSIEGHAIYSNFRRFQVEGRIVQ